MKRTTAIFFLSIFMLTNTELREILKTGAFISHFLEHKDINSHLTLFRFIDMHYLGNDIADDDDEKDQQLPFKNCNNHIIQTSFTLWHNQVSSPEARMVWNNENHSLIYDQTAIPSSYLSDIWQPPRHTC